MLRLVVVTTYALNFENTDNEKTEYLTKITGCSILYNCHPYSPNSMDDSDFRSSWACFKTSAMLSAANLKVSGNVRDEKREEVGTNNLFSLLKELNIRETPPKLNISISLSQAIAKHSVDRKSNKTD